MVTGQISGQKVKPKKRKFQLPRKSEGMNLDQELVTSSKSPSSLGGSMEYIPRSLSSSTVNLVSVVTLLTNKVTTTTITTMQLIIVGAKFFFTSFITEKIRRLT